MRLADNHIGYEVQRHGGPVGWQAVTEPFDTDGQARDHLRGMVKIPGAEYRVYPALAGFRQTQGA